MTDSPVAAGALSAEPAAGGAARSRNFLRFELAGEEYGIEISRVREVFGLLPVTPVPGAPKFIRGVINLGGRVIPVVDLKVKFGMDRSADTRETCLIVARISAAGAGDLLLGILLDRVREVFGDNPFSPGQREGYARANTPTPLEIDKLLTKNELAQLHRNWS